MKILIVNWRDIRNPEAGGAEIYYHEIFRRFAARGHRISVLAHAYRGAPPEQDIDGIHIVRRGSRALFNYAAIFYLRRHRREYDLVVEDINKIPFYTPLYLARPRVHLVMHFFGKAIFRQAFFPAALYVALFEKMIPLIYRREKFIAISDSTRAEIVSFGAAAADVHVVEPGVDVEFFRSTQPKAPTPLLVSISRLKKYKNIQFLIETLPEIRKRLPGVELHVAGTGEYGETLRAMARKAGLESAVHFPGYISEEQKRDLLSRATLFVNPSIKEGWGISNIEAALCGTVSLSSNVAGLRDSVRDGVTGVLFEYGNRRDFIEKACGLLTDAGRRARMEADAREYAGRFAWDIVADTMERTILRCMESGMPERV